MPSLIIVMVAKHTVCVRTHFFVRCRKVFFYFNPHIPDGMRRKRPSGQPARCSISIHTSQTGCDLQTRSYRLLEQNFNPHIPDGMRLNIAQFVHLIDYISIHTSQTGCDHPVLAKRFIQFAFQSTHPRRDATLACTQFFKRGKYFNPHIPDGMRQIFSTGKP